MVATGFSLWTDVRSPQRLVRQRITPFPAVACARRGLTVGDHGGNANGLRWRLNRDRDWLVCWTCSGRAAIQWVERNAQSDLDVRAGQAHVLDGQAPQLLLGSSSLSITVRMRSASR